MTNRTLYARLRSMLQLAVIALHVPAASAPALAQPASCATCLVPVVTPGTAATFPEALAGFDVFVRVDAGREKEAAETLDAIERRGGRAGLVIMGLPAAAPDAAVMARVHTVIVQLDGEPNAAGLLAVKKLLTSMRAASRAMTAFGVTAPSKDVTRELAPYVDFVAIGSTAVSHGLTQEWRMVFAENAAAALAATEARDVTRWLWFLPENAAAATRGLRDLTRPLDHPSEAVKVVAARSLTVDEIVARHQAAAARQTAAIREVISTGTLTIAFEAPGFAAPVTVGSETVIYAGTDHTDLEQRRIRVNGIEFRGRVWISMDTFAMVKVAATQTGLRGSIVSSEQIDTFREEASGLWLLARSEIRQLYEGAGHRTPITRVLEVTAHEVNPADFKTRRAAAYASSHVMLRDTPLGYRYLKRSAAAEGTTAAEPIVAGRGERMRMLAAGVIIDPNITRPLPFAGLSYVDFNLFGTGAQLNAFFGGSCGQLAFSVPSLGGSRWQLAGRAFGIASSYNDRSFVGGREQYEHNILQRPAHASLWLVRPLTTRMSLRAGYDLDYTRFARGEGTALDFIEPRHQVVHAARIAIDAQRGGWAASAWWNPARRQGWRRWGTTGGDEYRPRHRDFQRYGASLSRSVVVTPAVIAKLETAWMAGRDLDRFSRYAFGSFDNRLHGYPSALIRYDHGGVLRAAATWAAGRLVRFDAFADTAAVRDAAHGGSLRNYTGVGGAVEMPAPFGTLLAIEWGYGFRGVNADGGVGTHVVRINAFKIF